MPASPTKRTRTSSNPGASAGESHPKAQIIVVSSTPTRRPPGASNSRTPRNRTPRTVRSVETPRVSPSKPRKGDQTASPLRTPGRSASRRRVSPTKLATSEANSSQGDTDSSEDGNDGEENDGLRIETGKHRAILELPQLADGATIQRSTSDVYFHLNSKPARTSSNVFSSLLPQLSPEECAVLTSSSHIKNKHSTFLAALRKKNEANYARWEFELGQGFNLLLYGYGSKLHIINDFARRRCSRNGHVVVVNGFWSPAVSMRDVLDAICHSLPDAAQDNEASSPSGGIEAQTQRIYRYFAFPALSTPRIRRLFLVIHSIDQSAQLRTPRARACLSLLASNPCIHIIASIDNVHGSIIWTSGEMLGQSHGSVVDSVETSNINGADDIEDTRTNVRPAHRVPSSRGFAWLWHEAITFEPYDVELTFRDVSVLPRSRGNVMGDLESAGVVISGVEGAPINETAAKQVLASVTQKAKRLFELLGRAQLAAFDEKGAGSSVPEGNSLGMSYDILALRAREEFLAASDGALRALLTEFRDHGLVAKTSGVTLGSHENGGSGKIAGDILWIPLSRDVLARTLEGLNK